MALLDHSFHDLDLEFWLNNFEELTEPEYIIQNLDELHFSPEADECKALLTKNKTEDGDTVYDAILNCLKKQDMRQLYVWALYPGDFIKESGITFENENYVRFLSEFIPGFIMYRNQWDRKQLGVEIRHFINNITEPQITRRTSRIKQCEGCGYNLTDLFATRLTADNILDDTPVAVVCPHCNLLNYIKY